MIKQVGNNTLQAIRKRPVWALLIISIFLVLVVPLLYIPGVAIFQKQDNWQHMLIYLLPRYIRQTFILGVGTAIGSGLLGVGTAWIMSQYHFKGKMLFEVLLYLPLAVPAYIMAFSYAGFFETGGIFERMFSSLIGFPAPEIQIMNMSGLIMVMSLALYPYVYATVRSSFQMQSPSTMEAARILGASRTRAFWTVAFPSVRPATVAGISLVLMETFSEYGAVHYFGVENFTTGIFRAWFTLRDTALALKLAGFLLIFLFGFLAIEKYSRKRKAYYSISSSQSTELKKLTGTSLLLRYCVLLVPIIFGFIIPVSLSLYWSTSIDLYLTPAFWGVLGNTLILAMGASLLIMIIALLVSHASMLFQNTYLQSMMRLGSMGYAIPGAVISLAVLMFSNSVVHLLWQSGIISTNGARSLVVQLGFSNLFFAFLLRYMAVAFKPLESHYLKIGNGVTEAALSLGKTPWKALLSVNLPMLGTPLMVGGLLVFIDLVKELPMTMILRPFNFETLAVKAYYYSTNEMITLASPYSLALVAIATIPSIAISLIRIKQRRRNR